jgi:hypothetical protein
MMRFEPRLHIDAETAGLIESTTAPLAESPAVIVADSYPFPLAAEIVGDAVHVRAATGDELTAFLTVGDAPNPDDFEWPGDPALPAGREIAWQEKQDSEIELGLVEIQDSHAGLVVIKALDGSIDVVVSHDPLGGLVLR